MSTSTPFTAKLNTNYTPSDLEIPTLKKIVAEREATIKTLTLKIEELEEALSLARYQKASCMKDLEEHLALLSPVRRLPFDLLASIFHACLPETIHDFIGIASASNPSVVLSRVCQSWRTTALACPKLWSQLSVTIPSNGWAILQGGDSEGVELAAKVGKAMKAIDIWTARSGSSPLKLRIDNASSLEWTMDAGEMDRAYLTLIDAIKRTSTRWKEIAFQLTVGPNCYSLLELMRLSPTSLPLLEDVTLGVISACPPESDEPICSGLQEILASSGLFSAPSVRTLSLYGIWGDTSPRHDSKLWAPLTALHLDSFSPNNALISRARSIFQLMTHLQTIPTLVNVSFRIQGMGRDGDQQLFRSIPTPFIAPTWELGRGLVASRLSVSCFRVYGYSDPPPRSLRVPIAKPTFKLPYAWDTCGAWSSVQSAIKRDVHFTDVRGLTLRGSRIPKGFGPCLALPSLENLVLRFTSLIPEGIDSGLVEFILHYGAQLKSLTFHPDVVTRHALTRIFERLPNVEALSLIGQGKASQAKYSADKPGVDCNAITELNGEGRDGDPLRCPRLRRFELQTTGDRYEDDGHRIALGLLHPSHRSPHPPNLACHHPVPCPSSAPQPVGLPFDAGFLRQANIKKFDPATAKCRTPNELFFKCTTFLAIGITISQFGRIMRECLKCDRHVFVDSVHRHKCDSAPYDPEAEELVYCSPGTRGVMKGTLEELTARNSIRISFLWRKGTGYNVRSPSEEAQTL
ncbi:hypothetical protein NMY22_g190 [Coprinellus aureogranulatus]|nr:hypothetical protein NMY22_g190 [Coprinellus aureogranulatus]